MKVRITLDIDLDPEMISGGTRNGLPNRWDWNAILRNSDITAESATVVTAFEACCENRIEWFTDEAEWTFAPDDHNEDCIHFKPYSVDEDDEDEEFTATIPALDGLFGDPKSQLNTLISSILGGK